MEFLAIISGVVVGVVVFAGRRIDYVLILVHFGHIRSVATFETIYDNADDEATFSLNDKSLGVKTYAEYLRLHNAVRKTAYTRYRMFYDSLLRLVLIRMLPILLLPAILFWSRWYFYLFGLLIACTVIFTYKSSIVRHKVGFYQRMLIGAILANYQKEQKKKAKAK
ncbi:MAG TPA: hypothetical protein VGS08_00280 [Candidatus Saccharimonadales bacterium]|nr:hypothetical protein [Candidatus Saccharimonadales bacterium]